MSCSRGPAGDGFASTKNTFIFPWRCRGKMAPGEPELLVIGGAIRRIQVDKHLIRDAGFGRHALKIFDGVYVKVEGGLLLNCLA